jgi:hypothetical protein
MKPLSSPAFEKPGCLRSETVALEKSSCGMAPVDRSYAFLDLDQHVDQTTDLNLGHCRDPVCSIVTTHAHWQ